MEAPACALVDAMLGSPDAPPAQSATWNLVFKSPPRLPIFSNTKIEDLNGGPLQIMLVFAGTGSPLAPPQPLRIELVPLSGNSLPDNVEEWSADAFTKGIAKEHQGRRPLLTGDVDLTMRDGCVTVNELQFTEKSPLVFFGKFRIGARVVPGSYEGARIREAVTEAFRVTYRGGELYKKHYPPALGDDVWRLEKIGKESAFRRNLARNHVKNVQEFLRMLMVKPAELRAILGHGMTDRQWEATTTHAKTCVPGNEVYVHSGPHGTIYVDSICQLKKIEFGGMEFTMQQLNGAQRFYVQQQCLEAYKQRNNLKQSPMLQTAEPSDAVPAADILVDAMVKLPAKLDGLLIRHGHMLPKGAGDEIPLIKQDLEKMMTILLDHDNTRSKEPHMMVKCWMKEVRELSYDIDDCIHQYEHGLADPRIRSGFLRRKIFRCASSKTIRISRRTTTENLKRRLWMANKIREFSMRSQAALERYSSFDLGKISSSSTRFDVSFGSWHPAKYGERADHPVGINAPMNELEALLTKDKDEDQKLKVVSICGSGGIGKTMLANELYRKIGGQYECGAFVRTSKRPDIRRLLINMLSQVAPQHHPETWNVHSLIASIKTHLQNKRYLIVIDDVWATSTWEIVKCALPDGNCCSGILVTTVTEDVALRCCGYDSNYVFMMKPLGENDSSKLFFSTAFGPQHECPPELSEVTNSIIRKCGGLPLAIVTIASLLASRMSKAEQWDYVDKSLGYDLRKKPTLEGMRQVFNLSFNNLPQHLKACITYLSIYPEDYIIWKDDLVKQWTAEGFVYATEEKDEEEISRSYFDELLASRLIQPVHINDNDEVLSCTMHHMVLNFVIEENFVTALDHSQTTTRLADKVRRLSLQFGNADDATPPTNMRLSQVRTLAYFGVKYKPSFVEFRLLQVLILHFWGDEKSMDFDITRISELYRLKYLHVTSNATLELQVDRQGLHFFPRLLHFSVPAQTRLSDGIGHMTSLQTLGYFDLSSNSVENVVSLGELTNLQDLQLACCTIQTDTLKTSMQCLGIVLGKLSNLKSLTLVPTGRGSYHVGIDLSLSISGDCLGSMPFPPAFLRRLEFSPHVCIFTSLPEWIGQLARLCILKIAVTRLRKNDVDVLRGLPALTFLSLYVCTKLAERIVFDKGGFSVLEYLKFRCSVPCLKFEAGSLPNLRKLKLGFNAPRVHQHGGGASIIIDHLSGLREISAYIGGACADAEHSALTSAVSNHPINPRINVQFVEYTFYGLYDNKSTKEKEQVEILEEKTNEYEETQPEKRLHQAAFAIAVRMKMIQQDAFSMLDPVLARGVREEVEKELARIPRYIERSPDSPPVEPATWKLEFRNPLAVPIFTASKIEDVNGGPLQIMLVFTGTGSPLAPPQPLRIELVPLLGDSLPDDDDEWSADAFTKSIAKERKGECPLLTGDVGLTMRDGCVTVNELQFTDNSSWVRGRKFRIGARVVPGSYEGARIREAVTEAFYVREHRRELYRKHYPPVLGDDVWRLEKIGKEGAFHRKLARSNVKNVQEFLRMLMVKPDELRAILGDGMTDRMWETTTAHARTCVPGNHLYVYSSPPVSIYVDSICGLKKIEIGGVECTTQQLSNAQRAYVQQLLLEAYEQRNNLQEIPVLQSAESSDAAFSLLQQSDASSSYA